MYVSNRVVLCICPYLGVPSLLNFASATSSGRTNTDQNVNRAAGGPWAGDRRSPPQESLLIQLIRTYPTYPSYLWYLSSTYSRLTLSRG